MTFGGIMGLQLFSPKPKKDSLNETNVTSVLSNAEEMAKKKWLNWVREDNKPIQDIKS